MRLRGTGPVGGASGRDTPLGLLLTVTLLAIIPMIVMSQFIAYWRTDVVDDQMFGYFGWRIAHGGRVYLDVWDNKPPGIYWINALGFLIGQDSYLGVVAMCVLALVTAHACFFGICLSNYFPGAAALTTVLLSFYLTHGYYTGGTNRTETFVSAFELAGVLLYTRGFVRDRWWKWYAAGLCCGVAFLFKQVGLAAWGSMGLHTIVLVLLRELTWVVGLKRCLLLLIGAATSVGAAAAMLASQGALEAAIFATFTFNRAYLRHGNVQFPYNFISWYFLRNHLMPIMRLPILLAVAAVIHATLWRVRPAYRPAEIEKPIRAYGPACPRYMLLFGIWFLVSFYGALMSPHAFRHYLVPTIPPLLLICGHFLNVLKTELSLVDRMQQRAWVTGAFVLIGFLAFDAVALQWNEVSKVWVFRFKEDRATGRYQVVPAQWEAVGDVIKRITGPDDKIQCWGYLPGVYLHARRPNTCRFTTSEKVGQVHGEADFVMYELEQKLKAEPPVAMAMTAGDYYWLKGENKDGPPPAVLLGPWIDEHYTRVADVSKFDIYVYKRKDLLKPGDIQN